MSLWDTEKGSPPDLQGKTHFTPSSDFSMATPLIPLPGRGTSHGKVIIETRLVKMNVKR